ncbi:hypothetical protein ACLESD_02820 [Pyxidicoccus sp. 3LFB2]
MKKGNESPTDCLLYGQRTDMPPVLVASSFLVEGMSDYVPLEVLGRMHTGLEELARLASPGSQALLLSIQQALSQPLAGLDELESSRCSELLSCLDDIIQRQPRGMGKSARIVRKLLGPDVHSSLDAVPGARRRAAKKLCPDAHSLEEEIWEEVYNAAYRAAHRVLHDPLEAKSIAWQAMYKTFRWPDNRAVMETGQLCAFAALVAKRDALKVFERQKKNEALAEELARMHEALSTEAHGPGSEPADYGWMLGYIHQISELPPKDGELLFTRLLNLRRGGYSLLSAWLGKTSAALRTAVCRAREKLERLQAREGVPYGEVEAVLRAVEPLALSLAEAALTTPKEWPDPEDDGPNSGGTPKGGKKSAKSEPGGSIARADGGRAMAGNKSADEGSEGLLAMILNHAARTKKPIPEHLFEAAGAELLDAEDCEILRVQNPTKLASARSSYQKGKEQGAAFLNALSGPASCAIHVSRHEQQIGSKRKPSLRFTLISMIGELTTDTLDNLKRALSEPTCSSVRHAESGIILDLSVMSITDPAHVAKLLTIVSETQSSGAGRILILSRQPEAHELLTGHGVAVYGSYREALLHGFVASGLGK